ncbi:hypothetical protein PR001_g14242, partial [Phytophthora rubi]
MAGAPLSEDVKVTVSMDGVRTGPVRTEPFRRQPKTFNEAVHITMLEDHCVRSAQGRTPHVEATVVERPPVAKRSSSIGILKRQASGRNLYKLGEKAANHYAMMKRFNLRKMSSGFGIPTTFDRAVIDKAIGDQLQQHRRFSLHRAIRSVTNAKTRQQVFRALMSPITPKGWASTLHGILMLVIYHFQAIYLPVFACYFPNGSFITSGIAISLETFYLLNLLLSFNTA